MFKQARIKLTSWYLAIIMLIAASFSVAIYKVMTLELSRVERIQRLRIEDRLPKPPAIMPPPGFRLDPDLITETKNRLKIILVIINLVILGGSAAAGYFLSGKTLKPIGKMVETQSRFIADASHELRTPLTALKAEIEVSLRGKKLSLNQMNKLLKSNLEEVNNLQVLADGLIKLTQYQKETDELSFSRISLASMIKEAVKKVSTVAKNKQIVFSNQTKDLTVKGNRQALVEMLTIFLDNAVKYSPKQTKVRLTSAKNDSQVLIKIMDQGMGISKKDLPHVFDRFFRADRSRAKTNVPGYGLGLAIAKQIADRHHGSIKVQSQLNQGTVVTIKLPLNL